MPATGPEGDSSGHSAAESGVWKRDWDRSDGRGSKGIWMESESRQR